jgi:hypothetical protein
MNTDNPKNERSPDSERRLRRPYQKPAFKYERVFETMALSCGKIDPTAGPCLGVGKLS